MLTDWIPLLRDLRQYRREWLSHDVIAGLSVAAVQVPTAIAYANLAGFPPEVGLYASMLPVLVYALFGSSRQLIIGPDAATCAMVAALLLPLAQGNLAYYLQLSAALAIMAGIAATAPVRSRARPSSAGRSGYGSRPSKWRS